MPWTAASTHPGFHGMLSTPASNLQARMRTNLGVVAIGSLNCDARIAFLRDTLIG